MTPLHDVLGHDGTPGGGVARGDASAPRFGCTRRRVLRQIPEEPLQPVPMGQVFLADDSDVAIALRMDGYLKEGSRTGIPIGVYRAGGTDAPIYLDADFLIGPEAAHLNITGVSGLATKTSAIEWIMSSIFTHFPEQKGSIAAVCVQRQRPRPLLPRPARRRSATRIAALYEKCGVRARPVREGSVLRAVQVRRLLAQHAPVERSAAAQCVAAHVGPARSAAVR